MWDLHDSGDPGPAGLGDPVGRVGTPWIPLLPDRLRVRGTERGSEGSHEPVEAGTPGRGESGADQALACKLLRTSKK